LTNEDLLKTAMPWHGHWLKNGRKHTEEVILDAAGIVEQPLIARGGGGVRGRELLILA